MSATTSLRADGKPMRALRALAKAKTPLSEWGVWMDARRNENDTTNWHGALAILVRHGYAVRSGPHGGSVWAITEAGYEALKR